MNLLMLMENFWDAERAVATERYFVVDAATGQVERHAASMQAYAEADYRELLTACGFGDVSVYPSLSDVEGDDTYGLCAIVARKEREPYASKARRNSSEHLVDPDRSDDAFSDRRLRASGAPDAQP